MRRVLGDVDEDKTRSNYNNGTALYPREILKSGVVSILKT